MPSKVTGNLTICSTAWSDQQKKKTSKLSSNGLFVGIIRRWIPLTRDSNVDLILWYHQMLRVVISLHDDVIKWKHFPRYGSFVREIHRSLVNSPHKGQWRGALMFSLICARINSWADAGDLSRHGAHHDVTVMKCLWWQKHFHIYTVTLVEGG